MYKIKLWITYFVIRSKCFVDLVIKILNKLIKIVLMIYERSLNNLYL